MGGLDRILMVARSLWMRDSRWLAAGGRLWRGAAGVAAPQQSPHERICALGEAIAAGRYR